MNNQTKQANKQTDIQTDDMILHIQRLAKA